MLILIDQHKITLVMDYGQIMRPCMCISILFMVKFWSGDNFTPDKNERIAEDTLSDTVGVFPI